ncbi:MAG TPA: low-specificity L-threonine aldolase [Anaerolineales bacterium]|nr:low-specificity L-threonine aldolase [Anaerolineales bacterium]
MESVDLRSDTVTRPTPAMREAMAKAPVGDDVYGEDPTINRLQEMAARLLGKEAGLFVASGTMGNLVGVLSHCQRGDEVIVGKKNHVFLHEAGGISVLGGVHSSQLTNLPDGSLDLDDVVNAIRFDDPHEPVTRLVCLENTHNACGGTVQSPETIRKISDFAHSRNLSVHLDGARLFNAVAALGCKPIDLTGSVDSVTFCLSKGLCAPVGSVLCGSKAFIARALRWRKMLGGGMRQAGILAAAGIVALETMTARLGEDHARAKKLADGLSTVPGLVLSGAPETNMVFLSLAPEVPFATEEFIEKLAACGVLIGSTGERSYRLVTHYWIDDVGVERTVAAFHELLH